jgi:hypothetical protein
VENCEKHPKAQLAYSFDIAMWPLLIRWWSFTAAS